MKKTNQAITQLAQKLTVPETELRYLYDMPMEMVTRLVGDVTQAQQVQHDNVQSAAHEAIGHLPKLLQKPLRKLFQ